MHTGRVELVTIPNQSSLQAIRAMQRAGKIGTNGLRIGTTIGEIRKKLGSGRKTDLRRDPTHKQAAEATDQNRIRPKVARARTKGREKENQEKVLAKKRRDPIRTLRPLQP